MGSGVFMVLGCGIVVSEAVVFRLIIFMSVIMVVVNFRSDSVIIAGWCRVVGVVC